MVEVLVVLVVVVVVVVVSVLVVMVLALVLAVVLALQLSIAMARFPPHPSTPPSSYHTQCGPIGIFPFGLCCVHSLEGSHTIC